MFHVFVFVPYVYMYGDKIDNGRQERKKELEESERIVENVTRLKFTIRCFVPGRVRDVFSNGFDIFIQEFSCHVQLHSKQRSQKL